MANWTRIIVLTLLLTLVACGDEDIDRRYTDYRTDIVTFLDNDEQGAVFELLRRDDSTAVTLLGNLALGNGVKPGQRVLLRYDWADRLAADRRRVMVYGVATIVSDSLRYTVKPLSDYLDQMEPVKLLSIWRTGDYLNLRAQVEYTGKARHFYLLLDSATVKADTAHCYLVNNTHGDTTYHWREGYASFFVGNLWHRPGLRTMRVHVNDDNHHGVTTYDFDKQQLSKQ